MSSKRFSSNEERGIIGFTGSLNFKGTAPEQLTLPKMSRYPSQQIRDILKGARQSMSENISCKNIKIWRKIFYILAFFSLFLFLYYFYNNINTLFVLYHCIIGLIQNGFLLIFSMVLTVIETMLPVCFTWQ